MADTENKAKAIGSEAEEAAAEVAETVEDRAETKIASDSKKSKSGKDQKKDKKKEKKKKNLWKNLKAEFKKIIWPDKQSLFRQTVSVLITSIILGIIIFGLDKLIVFVLFKMMKLG